MTCLDFKREDGSYDWDAYRAAEKREKESRKESGRDCYKCGCYLIFGGKGYRELCADCKSLQHDRDEARSSSYVRCPNCRDTANVWDGDSYDICTEGEHEITCESCNHDYTVTTSVSYRFESPALIDGQPDKDEDEDEGEE